MYRILDKNDIAKDTCLLRIEAPEVAKSAKPGQFIILMIDDNSERIPLTIADYDSNSITIVFQIVGKSTRSLSKLAIGDSITHFLGPLGRPSHIAKIGKVVLVGGGLGIAPIYPQAKAYKAAGNEVIAIIGARSEKHIFWIDKFEEICDKVIVCTDDGSIGIKGFVTIPVKDHNDANQFVVIGPVIMMKNVAAITQAKTIVSLNPIMIDGCGMCGCCRITIDGENKFACVDGPEFEAKYVNFDELTSRNEMYKEEEQSVDS